VADFGFQGPSALNLDAKGRMAVPVRHREALAAACAGQLTITKHTDGCLLIFPRPAWEPFRAKISALPEEATRWKRFYLGGAVDVEVDASSRVLIPPELRTFAGITKDVMLMGMDKHFELWDTARQAAHEIAVMQQVPPEAVRTLSY
jgi:MraZ protein